MMSSVRLYNADCLEAMKELGNGSIDLILADLPYGTTACKWDTVIPFEPLWAQYKRIIKRNGAIVLTASQPFTTDLINSNREWFKYCWVWVKQRGSDFLNAKNKPMKAHEDVVVFSSGTTANCSPSKMVYNPQMVRGKPYRKQQRTDPRRGVADVGGRTQWLGDCVNDGWRYPTSILRVDREGADRIHATKKPVALMEYLIRTYSNEGETVLDNTMGSGTTGVACLNTGRHFIGMEKDAEIFSTAQKRIEEAQQANTEKLFALT